MIELKNIMVIFIYCKYDKFRYKFSKTFKKNYNSESLEFNEKRNSSYYWMSRILRETVECFGIIINDSKIKKYYHGANKQLIFEKFVLRFKGPISTTSSFEIATLFSDNNGIIVQFEQYTKFNLF